LELKIRYLIISAEYPPLVGGAGSFISDFIKGLIGRGDKIELITRRFKGSKLEDNSNVFKVHLVPAIPQLFLLLMWLKLKRLNLQNFDYVILNDIGAAYIGAFSFNQKILDKTICFLHGQEPETIINKPETLFSRLIDIKKRYLQLLIKSRYVFAVSEDMKEKMVTSCASIPDFKDKIGVVYNSYNPAQFYPDSTNIPQFDKKIVNIVTVSRIVKEKGFDLKLAVMCKLKESGIAFKWHIIGDREYRKEFTDKVSNSIINYDVVFLGSQTREQIRVYYSNADLAILLSEFRESFGLVYLEAIACGCPVIGLNYGGVREVVESGVNGYLIEKSDHMTIINDAYNTVIKLINQPLNKQKIIKSAAEFTIEKNIEKFYQQITLEIK